MNKHNDGLFNSNERVSAADYALNVTPKGQASDEEFIAEIIENCLVSRVYFAEVVLGMDLEAWQYDVLEALDKGATRISIRSGNGAGKTCLLAVISLHYLLFRNDVKIPVTAPSSGQLEDGLIPETRKWMDKLPPFLRQLIHATSDRIVRVDAPEQNFISFRTARKEKPEALQGIHATFVMCIVDEASGVDDAVYEAAQGTMSTPGSIFIMISNPTRLKGYFFRSHNIHKNRWTRFHVTSFDTSRVDQSFVDTISSEYGLESDQYRVKVMGEFPTRDEETLISPHLVREAFARDMAPDKSRKIMGVDVGRGGDASSLAMRYGHVVSNIHWQSYSDLMATVGWVIKYATLYKPDVIYIDSIGIGAGVADRLRELGYNVVDVNVAETAALKSKYPRLRDELWWTAKKWFESKKASIVLDKDDETLRNMLVEEFTSPLQLFTSNGRDAVESKQQMRSRGIKSPNIADSINLTFAYEGYAASEGMNNSATSWKKPLEYSVPHV